MRGPMDGQESHGYYSGEDCSEHEEDEPRGTFCDLRRRLSDAHGVDEGIRDEKE